MRGIGAESGAYILALMMRSRPRRPIKSNSRHLFVKLVLRSGAPLVSCCPGSELACSSVRLGFSMSFSRSLCILRAAESTYCVSILVGQGVATKAGTIFLGGTLDMLAYTGLVDGEIKSKDIFVRLRQAPQWWRKTGDGLMACVRDAGVWPSKIATKMSLPPSKAFWALARYRRRIRS